MKLGLFVFQALGPDTLKASDKMDGGTLRTEDPFSAQPSSYKVTSTCKACTQLV